MIGRFQKKSEVSEILLRKIISSKPALKKMPIIANVDFGHTMPIFTFPIGGCSEIEATDVNVKIHISH